MGVRREVRMTMSEESFLRIWESPRRRGPVDILAGECEISEWRGSCLLSI